MREDGGQMIRVDEGEVARLLKQLEKLHAEFADLTGIEAKIAEADAVHEFFRRNGVLRRHPSEEQRELRRRLGFL
jgi:hypothetical protein